MARKKNDYGFRPFEALGKKDRHLRIAKSMMDSKAWSELTIHARYLYIEMKAKYNYNNEDDISFTYAEGEKLMSKHTFIKSLDQLIDLGFIKIVRQSWTSREPNIYGFNDQWKHYGTDKFNVQSRHKRSDQN